MKDIPPKHPKRRGEWVELHFAIRALSNELVVAKPWGDSRRFDYFVVSHGSRISRVQVKSTTVRKGSGYICAMVSRGPTCPEGRRYAPRDVDFIACYVIPEDAWYVFPIGAVTHLSNSIFLNPHSTRSKYQRYLEAWPLLMDADARNSRSPGNSAQHHQRQARAA